ncbi:FAD:protein FMN transferase [Mesorhizobium sp. ES1-4]|uniref:FAD:protein FMN transferase n=1 Tax=Mesorhizobium sp. ES1-4 TaxID=2876627 RepID=UPI001CCD3EF1|nr:FAD:protein FMN transferase [Mesorhizobium sp. ES1-4]MBZ9798672.1 FAD:protein FMN transferase [Mesorhizobium sp. ES1-4]
MLRRFPTPSVIGFNLSPMVAKICCAASKMWHDATEGLAEMVMAEVRLLERIFSLYREDSDLTLLNRQRFLAAPPRELVDILQRSREVWMLNGGAFDPLWDAYPRRKALNRLSVTAHGG